MYDDDGNYIGWGDEGGDVGTGDVEPGEWTDNEDGSYTDADGQIFDVFTGELLGWENEDGSWFDVWGNYYDADGNPSGEPSAELSVDETFVFDPATGLYYDEILGAWYMETGDGGFALSDLQPRDLPGGETSDPGTLPTDLDTSPGFFEKVGNFFAGLFGGAASGAPSGGGSFGGMSGGGAAQARENQAQQKLNQAQQSGANPQQIAQLQQQLALARAAANSVSGGVDTKTILFVSLAAAGVYVLTRPRTRNPSPRRRKSTRRRRR